MSPIAEGVGVIGGTAFVMRFFLGVDGLELIPLGRDCSSLGMLFRFLLVFAALGGVEPFVTFVSSLSIEETALKRADRLEDIMNGLEQNLEEI